MELNRRQLTGWRKSQNYSMGKSQVVLIFPSFSCNARILTAKILRITVETVTVTSLVPVSKKSPSSLARLVKSGRESWFASQHRNIQLYLITNI